MKWLAIVALIAVLGCGKGPHGARNRVRHYDPRAVVKHLPKYDPGNRVIVSISGCSGIVIEQNEYIRSKPETVEHFTRYRVRYADKVGVVHEGDFEEWELDDGPAEKP